ncbi:uncharacterized protein LOC126879901 [Diabrotica virgifera virgifera]|uniref:CHK kinase-like domain-containing protein n=2 Tax=Diabrotica virgifera virgifera TaxID=50390 RepID=A0ABM5JMN5_DIAVI|nr:uncharacterized protein LOC126879901 [Diabrotica virgifera virgifera]
MELSKEQKDLIDRVAKQNGFSDYQVISNAGSFKGDNFLGVISTVTIKSGDKTLDLILKSAHTSEAFRKAAPLHEIYNREIYLYNRVFEEFKKFQEEHNIVDPFISFPKAYLCSSENGHEALLMENLKTQGYKLWNKKTPMNPGHIKAVLKEYAKFHAISLAMKDKCPEQFNDLASKVYENVFEEKKDMFSEEKFQQYITSAMNNGYEVVEGDAELTNCVRNVESKIIDLFIKELKKEKYKLVITHGDCWCNNFLFKYEDPENIEKPSSLRILDWQISSVTSPAYDITYFFLVNSPKEILYDYKTYMKLYHDTLSTQLLNFGCDPQKLFSYSLLEDHLEALFPLALYMSFMIVKVMISESDEAPDFAEISEKDGDIVNGMNFTVKNMDEYQRRIKDILSFLKDNKYI